MPKTSLTAAQITAIRRRVRSGEKQADIAAELGIDKSRVSRIASGESFRDGQRPIPDGASMVSMTKIRPDPDQPRKHFDDAELASLAASIKEIGLIQPITVRPDGDAGSYLIVAGERRYRAFQLNGATEIPAQIKTYDRTGDVRVAQVVENLQRSDINPMDEARAYQGILEENGWTAIELARKLGLRYGGRVSDRVALLALNPEYQQLVATGQMATTVAFEFARLTPRRQDDLFRVFKSGKATTQTSLRQYANARNYVADAPSK